MKSAFNFRFYTTDVKTWKMKAEECSMTLTEWITRQCNGHDKSVLERGKVTTVREVAKMLKDAGAKPFDGTKAIEVPLPLMTCGHPGEPGMGGKCRKWGCDNYAFKR